MKDIQSIRDILFKVITESGYYENMNDTDKAVRGHMDLNMFLSSCVEYEESKNILSRLESGLRSEVRGIILFDPLFESGHPHTHGRYIFLPRDFKNKTNNIDRLIKHEAIHIWQRYHPCEASQYVIRKYQCPISGIQVNKQGLHYRSNPDINKILYGDITNEYKSYAKSLGDIKDKRDHPYEMMAYEGETIDNGLFKEIGLYH